MRRKRSENRGHLHHGFAETGDEEGKKREAALLQVARKEGIRLIGPNCMGIYYPKNGMAFFPGMPKEPGKVGMISQEALAE